MQLAMVKLNHVEKEIYDCHPYYKKREIEGKKKICRRKDIKELKKPKKVIIP